MTVTASPEDVLAEVLAAVERGWSVIPVGHNKRPLVRWKHHQERRADAEEVQRWARERRPPAWAVVTGKVSGIFGLDFDGEQGRELRELLELREQHCKTGSGGSHTYFKHPGDRDIPTLNGKAKHALGQRFPGLDIRGDGGYLIFAGRNGAGPYRLLDPEPLPLDRLPHELRAELGLPPISAERLLEWALRRAVPGARNQTGFELAVQLRDNGHDEATAQRVLREYVRRVPGGDHAYGVDEGTASVRSAYEHPAREPWGGSGAHTAEAIESDPPVLSGLEKTGRGEAPQNPGELRRTAHVTLDSKGKMVLPPVPDRGDTAGLCAWLTAVFELDRAHPITGGRREGLHGADGHVHLSRATAQPIRFEPARVINNPTQLITALSWQLLDTDGKVHAFKAEHCREISYAIRLLCTEHEAMTHEQEAEGIVGTFLQAADAVEGHTTYGTSAQRYEAALALRRDADPISGRQWGAPQYLIDTHTAELVIAVSDLQDAARRHVGSSLPRGWLDARMQALGWERITLDGHAEPGRHGRQGPHARINAYRGRLPGHEGKNR